MRFLLAFVLLLAGCASRPIVFRGDRAFTDQERVLVQMGADFISEKTGRGPIEIVWDLPHGSGLFPLPTVRREHLPDPRLGLRRLDGVIIDADKWSRWGNENALVTISAHEFGHFLGLQHHDGPGIMAPTVGPDAVPTWTAEDQASCVRDEVCD